MKALRVIALLAVACRGSDQAKPAADRGAGSAAADVPPPATVLADAAGTAPLAGRVLIDEMRELARVKGDRAKATALHEQAMQAHTAKGYAVSERLWADAARADASWERPYYNLACSTAMQGRGDDAIAYLEIVRDLGADLGRLRRIETDPDLDSIRDRPAFRVVHAAIAVATAACPDGMVRVPAPGAKLAAFCIDKTEVTVAAYASCVAGGPCTAAKEPGTEGYDSLCNGKRVDWPDHPANCIGWDQANTYCASVEKRLPTEAEWEYAANGGEDRTYPWGNDAPDGKRLNACGFECGRLHRELQMGQGRTLYDDDDGWETTAPVGAFSGDASAFGVLDMGGNVSEWTADRGGAADRAIRGGGWYTRNPAHLRATRRDIYEPAYLTPFLGFRCVRGDPPSQ